MANLRDTLLNIYSDLDKLNVEEIESEIKLIKGKTLLAIEEYDNFRSNLETATLQTVEDKTLEHVIAKRNKNNSKPKINKMPKLMTLKMRFDIIIPILEFIIILALLAVIFII